MINRRLVIGVFVAIVVLIAGVAWFATRPGGSEPDQMAPVAMSAPELEAAGEGQRLFRIDPDRSTARYHVFEEFLDATVKTPVGETSAIAGDIVVDPGNPGASRFGTIVVNVESLVSDSPMRDSRLRKAYLESATYPEVRMQFGRLLALPESFEQGEEYNLQLEGDLTVKGITAPATWDATFGFDDELLRGAATADILMSTYGIGPISIAGLLNARDEMTLTIDFVAYDIAFDAGTDGALVDRQLASASDDGGNGGVGGGAAGAGDADDAGNAGDDDDAGTAVDADSAFDAEIAVDVDRVGDSGGAGGAADADGAGDARNGPSFAGEILPILSASCVTCHQPGEVGSGHWSLATAADAARFADDLALVTRLAYMPPWKPGGATPALLHERRLSAEQRASLQQWAAAGGALDVEPDTPVPPSGPVAVQVRADLVLSMSEPYMGTGELTDDYRCFLLDPEFAEDTFITGFSLEPGERRVAHHSLVYLASDDARDDAVEAAEGDALPGWECFGGPGIPGVGGVIASWVPGQTATAQPEGTGFLVPAGSFFVFQMHYNYEDQVLPDQTSLVLQTEAADGGVRALQAVPLIAPVEIPCSDPDAGPQCGRGQVLRERFAAEGLRASVIPGLLLRLCGRTAEQLQEQEGPTVTSWCDSPMRYSGSIVEVGGHMHTMGNRFSLTLNPGADDERVLFEIPQWDFNWQGRYQYETPVHVDEGDTVRISCTWNKGAGQAQKYTTWGEGTHDEMCLSSLTVLPDDPDSVPSRRSGLSLGFRALLDRITPGNE